MLPEFRSAVPISESRLYTPIALGACFRLERWVAQISECFDPVLQLFSASCWRTRMRRLNCLRHRTYRPAWWKGRNSDNSSVGPWEALNWSTWTDLRWIVLTMSGQNILLTSAVKLTLARWLDLSRLSSRDLLSFSFPKVSLLFYLSLLYHLQSFLETSLSFQVSSRLVR